MPLGRLYIQALRSERQGRTKGLENPKSTRDPHNSWLATEPAFSVSHRRQAI